MSAIVVPFQSRHTDRPGRTRRRPGRRIDELIDAVVRQINRPDTLHRAMLAALHELSDEECLQQAADIRLVLTALLENVAQMLRAAQVGGTMNHYYDTLEKFSSVNAAAAEMLAMIEAIEERLDDLGDDVEDARAREIDAARALLDRAARVITSAFPQQQQQQEEEDR